MTKAKLQKKIEGIITSHEDYKWHKYTANKIPPRISKKEIKSISAEIAMQLKT